MLFRSAAYHSALKNAEPDKENEDKTLPELSEGDVYKRQGKQFRMGKKYGTVSFLQILAPELNDRLLAD